jgi:hypothetical protein
MYQVIRSITDRVQLIKNDNQVLILKTYKDYESKTDTMEYIDTLNMKKVPTLQYYEIENIEINQLCLQYLPKFHTFDKRKSDKDYQLVGQFMKLVHNTIDIGIGNIDNSNIMIVDESVFFLNPNCESTQEEDIEAFLKQNLSKSKHFTTSLNQQETRQNEFLDCFWRGYNRIAPM